ncbi:mechanosensitive ion channel family protein [Sporomusa carbonis]|uniref:mechanosensitive ion channel family protein n=1 Tax=Sporomusa carbonis TaxID=3076075 RepID=UPI003C79A55F
MFDVRGIFFSLAVFLICNALGVIISKGILSKLNQMVANVLAEYSEVVSKALRGMPVIWGGILGSYSAMHIIEISAEWLRFLGGALIVIGVFSLTMVTARMLSEIVTIYARKAEGAFPSASILANIAEVLTYLTGTLILLQTFGISIAPILTALGVGGLAVALALQDTLSNLFSGLHILLSKQIKAGDYVKLSTGEEGNVVDISWRNTIIKALGNNLIIVPNQKIASTIITNYHMPDKELSVLVAVGVSYASNLEHVEKVTIEVAKEVMSEIAGSIENFEPVIRFHTFGDSSINFNVVLRVKEFVDQYLIKHEFIKRLHVRYNQEGIEIPFPIRTIHTKQV